MGPCYVCLVAWSSPALCNPMDYSPPVSSVHGIFQARMLEQVAISYQPMGSNPCLLHLLHRPEVTYPVLPGKPLGGLLWLFLALCQMFPANYFKGSLLPQFKMTVSDLQTCICSPKALTRNLCVRNQSCASVWSLYPSKVIVHTAEVNPLCEEPGIVCFHFKRQKNGMKPSRGCYISDWKPQRSEEKKQH